MVEVPPRAIAFMLKLISNLITRSFVDKFVSTELAAGFQPALVYVVLKPDLLAQA